jgi:hypothetical protein
MINSFVLLQDDLDLMKSLNFDAYQFCRRGELLDGRGALATVAAAVANASLGEIAESSRPFASYEPPVAPPSTSMMPGR